MQISNNYASQNFGMALKIKPGAEEALKKLPAKTLQRLVEVGEELKGTKHCDLVVEKDGSFIVDTLSAIKFQNIGAKVDSTSPEFLHLEGIFTGTPSGRMQYGSRQNFTYMFPNKETAREHFDAIDSATSSLEKAVATVKAIEASGAYRAVREAEEAAQKERVNTLVGDLLSKYSNNIY